MRLCRQRCSEMCNYKPPPPPPHPCAPDAPSTLSLVEILKYFHNVLFWSRFSVVLLFSLFVLFLFVLFLFLFSFVVCLFWDGDVCFIYLFIYLFVIYYSHLFSYFFSRFWFRVNILVWIKIKKNLEFQFQNRMNHRLRELCIQLRILKTYSVCLITSGC